MSAKIPSQSDSEQVTRVDRPRGDRRDVPGRKSLNGGAKKSRRAINERRKSISERNIVRVTVPMPDQAVEAVRCTPDCLKLTKIGGNSERYVRAERSRAATSAAERRTGKAESSGRACSNKAASSDRRRQGRTGQQRFQPTYASKTLRSGERAWARRLRAVCLRDAPESKE